MDYLFLDYFSIHVNFLHIINVSYDPDPNKTKSSIPAFSLLAR